jgi:hypothetical protein
LCRCAAHTIRQQANRGGAWEYHQRVVTTQM